MIFFLDPMRHRKAKAWEKNLKSVFDEIDSELENDYGGMFSRHPARAPDGGTSNPEMDGLFNVGASFSAGFGSRFGPGYVVDIQLSTLDHVPGKLKSALRDQVQALLIEKLPVAFPGKDLRVDKELGYLRIHGDLSLD
jgi:hypothetical protein